MAAKGFIKLLEIAERSKQRSLGLLGQGGDAWTGVGFMLSGQYFLAPIGEVAEILKVPRYTMIPGVANWMKGLANVRGRLLPIMDLLVFLNRRSVQQGARRRILVIDHEEIFSGVIVDEVLGMQHFPSSDFNPGSGGVFPEIAPFVRGSFVRDGRVWYVLLMSRLIEDPRFLKASAA
jgi:twitching motility protein PilI